VRHEVVAQAECDREGCAKKGRVGGQHRAPCGGRFGGKCGKDWLAKNEGYVWVKTGNSLYAGVVKKEADSDNE
jgi:hypothetical protein